MAILDNGLLAAKPSIVSTNIGTIGPPSGGIGEGAVATPIDVAGTAPYKGDPQFGARASYPANILRTYSELWFGQVHLLPSSVDLGNVLVDVSGQFEIYNAFLDASKDVTGQISSGGAGITITPPSGYPVTLPPLKGGIWLYDVSATNGPSDIDAIFEYAISGAPDVQFAMTGNRSVLFPFACERPMRERLEFLTNVLEARDGTEQRVMVRADARQYFDMSYLLSDPQQIAAAKNLLTGYSGNNFAVIMWQYTRSLLADLSASDTVISVDTTFAEFRVGDQVILWRDWNDFEIGTIDALTDTTVTVEQPLTSGHDAASTLVLPLQFCLGDDPAGSERYQNNVTQFDVQWESVVNQDYADISTLATYKSKPVFTDPNFMSGNTVSEASRGDYTKLDYNTGVIEAVVRKLNANPTSQRGWEPETPEDLFRLREFIHWTRGKLRTWWLPTWRQDFQLDSTTAPADTFLTVKNVNYASLVGAGTAPFTDIYIRLNDGTEFFREILSATDTGATESIEIDSSLGQSISPSDIEYFSFLMRVRFNTDRIQIDHRGQGRATVFAPVYGTSQ